MELNFGKYLKMLMPNKRQSFAREDFLSEIFNPLIEKYDIVNRNGEDYIITRELTSNLFRSKVDLPQVLQNALNRADNEKNLFFNEFKEILEEYIGEEQLLVIAKNIIANKMLDSVLLNKFKYFCEDELIYDFHWRLFKYLGNINNKGINRSLRSVGRPSKDAVIKDFFYLSEEEKCIEFKRMIKNLSKVNAKLTISQLNYFLSAIHYAEESINKKTKEAIVANFLSILKDDRAKTNADILIMYFQEASMTFGNMEIYAEWIKLIPSVAFQKEIEQLSNFRNGYMINGDIVPLYDEINRISNFKFFTNNDEFKRLYLDNDFFMIDFFGSIDHYIWSYCHLVAELSGAIRLYKEFEEYILQKQASTKNTRTVSERCSALIEKCNSKAGYLF